MIRAKYWYIVLMNHYHFPVVIERDRDGYVVSCPSLQGCYTQGKTYEAAIENIKDAIRLHVEDRLEANEDIPTEEFVGISAVDIAV